MLSLTRGQVCSLSGVPAATLDKWVWQRTLIPGGARVGSGHRRTFTVPQATAVVYAEALRQIDFPPWWTLAQMEFVASLTEEQIDAELAAGRVMPARLPFPLDLGDLTPQLTSGFLPLVIPDSASPDMRERMAKLSLVPAYRAVKDMAARVGAAANGALVAV